MLDLKKEADLQSLIDSNIPEDTNLDYKHPDALSSKVGNNEIAKDVSAMANSDGGIIIYGISEDSNKLPSKIEWITSRDGKEKIEQVVNSRIFPKIEGLKVEEVPSDASNQKFVLVVSIPKSYTGPHQAHLDGQARRYFGRRGSTSSELEHYEVENLFNRRKGPMLKPALERENSRNFIYTLLLENDGNLIGEKIAIKMLLPYEFEVSGEGWQKIKDVPHLTHPHRVWNYWSDEIPSFPQVSRDIGKIYHPKQNVWIQELDISLFIVCKDMPARLFKMNHKFPNNLVITTRAFEEGLPLPSYKES